LPSIIRSGLTHLKGTRRSVAPLIIP